MKKNLTIVCPHCLVCNRLPAERIDEKPKCGKCHQALFMGKPINLDDTSMTRFVESNQTPLLADFWAPWCGPCVQMAPAFTDAAGQLEPRVRFAKINTEDNPTLSARYQIRSIPTMILFDDNREIARTSGAMNTNSIVNWVCKAIPSVRL